MLRDETLEDPTATTRNKKTNNQTPMCKVRVCVFECGYNILLQISFNTDNTYKINYIRVYYLKLVFKLNCNIVIICTHSSLLCPYREK